MLVFEYKLKGNKAQYAAIDEAIRITQFIRNKALRLWVDGRGITKGDLQALCAVLAKEYPFADRLDAQARQAAAERAWCAIARFYKNCREHKPGKKGYPKFQKDNRSVEYKVCGWKLESDGKHLTLRDKCGIGTLKLIGTRSIETFPKDQIKRVRILKRADGYFVQFCVKTERCVEREKTGSVVGIDMGIKVFYADSNGNIVENPRFLRKSEKKLKLLHRRVSKKKKGSHNRLKARQRLAKKYLQVSRQRKDFACKQARALVSSHDLIAYENLQTPNMVKNHHLAKSISDAAWGQFRSWMQYYALIYEVKLVAVAPQFTSQNCSGCGTYVQKSLSERTHACPTCKLVMDRDENAAVNILYKALRTDGQSGTPSQEENASGEMVSTAWGAIPVSAHHFAE